MTLYIVDLVSPDFEDLNNVILSNHILSLTPSSCYYLDSQKLSYKTFHDLISVEEFSKEIQDKYADISFIEEAQEVTSSYYAETIKNFIEKSTFTNIIYFTDRVENSRSISSQIKISKTIKIKDVRRTNNRKTLFSNYSFKIIIKKILNKILIKKLKYDWILVAPKNLKKNINQYQTFLTKETYFYIDKFKNRYPFFFFQHGSYLYKNLFLKYLEIEPADINFVFNDYTKKLFESLGSTKVYSVGSILFNKSIIERKKRYDFLYITQGHDYTGNLQYVDFPNSLHSFDGYELYQKHKAMIKLFGTKFKDKKIIIRVHPTVVTTGVYVPFWELAEPYSNITIDVSTPIHRLIEESKYIISDYFTTEFINRELHYKRDIILFQGAPTPLPEETLEDMQKMFILVDTVDDLEEKVKNIEKITKNRKRYDEIIEYYSSKKCDTKKVVTEILEKELNARR